MKTRNMKLKEYQNVYKILVPKLIVWYLGMAVWLISCLVIAFFTYKMFVLKVWKTALFLACILLTVTVCASLYYIGKFKTFYATDFETLDTELCTLKGNIKNIVYFTNKTIIVADGILLSRYEINKIKKIYFSDIHPNTYGGSGMIAVNGAIHLVKKDNTEDILILKCDYSTFVKAIKKYYPKIKMPRSPLIFKTIVLR